MSEKEPAQPQDKYVLRMPDGLRDRIKASAERNGRSMNAEMVAALMTAFPEQPTVEELLDKVHRAIDLAAVPNGLPYRRTLIEALDRLSERITSGLEFDQARSGTAHPDHEGFKRFSDRYLRWNRVRDEGVDLDDLKRELAKGMLDQIGRDRLHTAIMQFRRGVPQKALKTLTLGSIKFAEPDASEKAIESYVRQFYSENWGDPDESWQAMVDDD